MKIPVSLFSLPDELFKLYGAIRSFDWDKKGRKREGCVAKVETLAELVRKSERATQTNLTRLEACGAVRIERRTHLPNLIFCTPDGFDPARVKPAAPHPEAGCTPRVKSTAQKGEVHRTQRVKPAAPEVDTFKQRPEVETITAPATPAAAAPLVLSADGPKKPAKAPKAPAVTTPTWEAYAAAYAHRYGAPPVRDALVNRQLKDFVARVGVEDAPEIAAHYLANPAAFYVTQHHPIGLLLRDYQKVRTEWLTGRRTNAHTARQNEQTAGNAAWAYAKELEEKERKRS